MITTCRVRFAPSPTGIMHIGNVRTALLNYLFALQHKGTFIIRIEDTDQQRNINADGKQIIDHLAWLGMNYQEGPFINGPYAPYYQSQRNNIYKKNLEFLEKNNHVYRCFCTTEQLEIKRNRQIALKNPPRYDRTCTKLSAEQIAQNLANNIPFFWRFKLDDTKTISFKDLGHGSLTFDLKNFSDFAISRTDGSFTFMFANCIDDMEMKITHILRGQDHLTNTVGQVAIMMAMNYTIPTFLHLPILFNVAGKKLSKRDQGFSLEDLKNEGFLPQAIVNYLGIIGASFEEEILSLEQLAHVYNFDKSHTSNQIKYDIEKLRWVNHKWIVQTPITQLVELCKPYLAQVYDINTLSDETLSTLITSVQTDIVTLADTPALLEFYFSQPTISQDQIDAIIPEQAISHKIGHVIKSHNDTPDAETFFKHCKKDCQAQAINLKDFFSYIRLLITGKTTGLSIAELEKCLGFEEIKRRLNR